MSLEDMQKRIRVAGGSQDGRNVKAKLKSMQSALKNSYQAEWITFDNDETIIIDMQFEKYRNRTSLSSGQGVCSFVATSFEEVKNHRIEQLKDKHKIIQDIIKSKNFELSEVLELIEFWNTETEEKYYVGQDANSNN